jgi:thiol-disulfide isomerase/thioredoxin
MRSFKPNGTKAAAFGWLFVLLLSVSAAAQTKRPVRPKPVAPKTPVVPPVKVTQVDEAGLRKLLVPNGKPLLINFWATWCDPCREEFPDLVKLDQEYKGRIDFLTVSLDDPEDIATTVPKFLASMKAEMPAYLLKTPDESAVIASISKDWHGGMPFTALYKPTGELAYFREGKVIMETLRSELDKLTTGTPAK